MKKNIKYMILSLAAAMSVAMTSCIENDIPYARIQANILSLNADGLKQPAVIDSVNCRVTLNLDENVDIHNVNITEFKTTAGASIVGEQQLPGVVDLSNPYRVTLRLYQDYVWTIKAVQNIERNFVVANQVGATSIDVPAKRVVAHVAAGSDMSAIEVKSIKLGSETAVYTPDLSGQVVDFTEPVTVDVTEYGRTQQWTIYVLVAEQTVALDRVDAWTKVAWLYGSAEAGKETGFEYRLTSSDEWLSVPQSWVTVEGGSFVGRLIHLEPNADYVARAYSDGEYSPEVQFTTGSEAMIPNASFDDWYQNGKVWNPWSADGQSFWDTGNKGAATLGQSNSVPTDDVPAGLSGKAARLETKFIGIASLGKLAAGNLFTGQYYKTDGTNGILKFGREFTERPTKLTGYMKYNCATISHSNDEYAHLKGRPDTATVYMILADWTEPFEIRTNPKNRQLIDLNSPEIIAYGALQWGETISEYTPFEINLEYRATDRRPRYAVIVSSASKYGDFFTGGEGSVLCVDDFKLHYDYE